MNHEIKNFYLIPNQIGESENPEHYPLYNIKILEKIDLLIVENPKPTRAFLKKLSLQKTLSEFEIYSLPQSRKQEPDYLEIENLFLTYNNIGFMSDAGLPCIADPGALLVTIARRKNFKINPLVGASSLMLGLMASGLNGQRFVFEGYLPVNELDLRKRLREIERNIATNGSTHFFIETPYRNQQLLEFLLKNINTKLRLCLALNLLQNDESIHTLFIEDWIKTNFTLDKKPCVFYLGI
jgi:16S rRNA (cytidine1402-2'-O)-methyltransferase